MLPLGASCYTRIRGKDSHRARLDEDDNQELPRSIPHRAAEAQQGMAGQLSCGLFIVRLRYPYHPIRERVADSHLAANVAAVGVTLNNVLLSLTIAALPHFS
jgi:hypothetical protein